MLLLSETSRSTSTGERKTTTQANAITTLNINQLSRKISQYLKTNPATAFILAFEALLLVAAAELIEGNVGGANAVVVYAFVALVIGVSLHAISVIKGSKKAVDSN